jgi:hypothetical protein
MLTAIKFLSMGIDKEVKQVLLVRLNIFPNAQKSKIFFNQYINSLAY